MASDPIDSQPSVKELKKALQKWNSPFIDVHLDADAELKSWGAKTPELLLQLLQGEMLLQKRKKSLFYALLTFGIGIGIAWIVLSLFILHKPELLGLLGMLGSFGGLAALFSPSRHYLYAMQVLSETEDVRFVGYLAEALFIQVDARTKIAIARTLFRLLPQLTPESSGNLTNKHRNALYRILRTNNLDREASIVLATLDALERLNDTNAIPGVKALSQSTGTSPRQHTIREKARVVLIHLEEVRANSEMGSQLLRAAMPTVSGAELLRPASKSHEEEPQLLLRPSNDNK